MNKVELAGGLTTVPELKYTPGGWPILSWTLAVNGARYDSKERQQVVTTSFIRCEMAGPNAEYWADELGEAKGEKLYVLGELSQQSWEDREGKKQSRTRVDVMVVHRLSPKNVSVGMPKPEYVEEDESYAPF